MSESAFGIDHGDVSKAFSFGGAARGAAAGAKHVGPKKPQLKPKLQSYAGAAGNTLKGGAQQAGSAIKQNPVKSGVIGGGALTLTGGVYGAGKASGKDQKLRQYR